jgi:coenzyme PQQ synthesis protein D (PqqD)
MKAKQEEVHPQARKEGLVIQELSEEVLVYDLHRDKAHCLNQTAAAVWRRCDGNKRISEIAEQMEKEFNVTIREEVALLGVQQLEQARLLVERIPSASGSKISRREVMRRAGVVAIGLPAVTTILALTAAQAATCRANGEACNGNGQCCSHNCVANVCA